MSFRKTSLVLSICASMVSACSAFAQKAEELKPVSLTVKPGSYVDLHGGKVYAANEAAAHKADLDFVYLASRSGGHVKRELFDLSGKDTALPPEVLGTKAGIVALTWDDALIAKCKTTADLKRMTGSYSKNSFSFAATISNNRTGDLESDRFIVLDRAGRMGFFTVKAGPDDVLQIAGKIIP
jgi:hypothetical protein